MSQTLAAPTEVAFVDLTHTGQVIDANNFPLGIAYIAATALAAFGEQIDAQLFKYPNELSEYLDRRTPDIAAFSNYMWNERLQLAYASAIKREHPEVATIFGGPNFPIDAAEQESWLRLNPQVDFYIDGEGELACVELMKVLVAVGCDAQKLKTSRPNLPNLCFVDGDEYVRTEMVPRILDLDEAIPSPYLIGLMDRFFDGKLTPMMQTSRGCPYSCTFCHDGISYMTKTRRFSQARIDAELQYVFDRVDGPALTLADLNWGMFPEDIDTAKTLARMKEERSWPRHVLTATAKNQKKRVVEMARILGGSMYIGASIQSTDAEVLKNIKRSNIGFDAILEMAKESKQTNTQSFTEIILSLPGDTRAKHFKSICDMLDAGIEDIRSYQFILLPGTEAADPKTREAFDYETRFRVLPRCFGRYTIYGQIVPIAEIHEVCLANNTMSYDEYVECRWFDLTLQIFNNGGLLEELLKFADILGVKRSTVMTRIHDLAVSVESPMRGLYEEFRDDEARNFWPDRQSLLEFVGRPEGFDAYLNGEYGSNQIYKYRVSAVITMLDRIVDIAVEAIKRALAAEISEDERIGQYIDELREVIVARRFALTDFERRFERDVHFDFVELGRSNFLADPRSYWSPVTRRLTIGHTESKRAELEEYFRQYDKSLQGLAYLVHRNPSAITALYRDFIEEREAVAT